MRYLMRFLIFISALTFHLTSCQPNDVAEPVEDEIENPEVQNPNIGPPGGNNGGNNGGSNGGNNGNNLSALPLNVIDPGDNPTSFAKVELGRALFWDPVLSGDLDVACATCHHPSRGYGDGIPVSIGVGGVGFAQERTAGELGLVRRNAPTIINSAFNDIDEAGNYDPATAVMFWDNKDQGLESQALGPIHSLQEMRGTSFTEDEIIPEIIGRLSANDWYRLQFSDAFGPSPITEANIAKAIAAFERTIIANNSRFDQYMRGNENILNAQEIRGLNAFRNVGCIDCHSGPMLSDYELHILGVRESRQSNTPDTGDGNFAFRTPTLRNLEMTGPYMHNGELRTLQDVLRFYDDNARNSQNPNVPNNLLDPELRNLQNLNGPVRQDIIAFLRTLNDDQFDRSVPDEVPSGLNPGGNINNQ